MYIYIIQRTRLSKVYPNGALLIPILYDNLLKVSFAKYSVSSING